jgi:hypothetical protein
MGLIKSLDELAPMFRPYAVRYLAELEAARLRYVVLETRRIQDVQDAYYAQGRFPLDYVNDLRSAQGLYLLTEVENRSRVTDSRILVLNGVGHGNGTAMDVCAADAKGNPFWKAPADIWFAMGEIAEMCGLVWGGRFKPLDQRTGLGWDPAHVQMRRPQ